MAQPMISIHNNHVPQCGDPPIIDTGNTREYVGYFANSWGEQLIFTFDRETGIGILRSGDCGWNETCIVENGVCKELVLGPAESMWLAACWTAVSG
jgi:hypothetical protein